MTALLNIKRRPTEAKDQKVTETLFRTGEITAGIHRAEDLIVRNLPVKGGDQSAKAVFANGRIDILFFQRADRNTAATG